MSNTAVLEKKETRSSKTQTCLRAPIAIYESDEHYTLLVELLGADEKTIQVEIQNDQLRVEAKLKPEVAPTEVHRYSELRLGDYVRTLELNDAVDPDKVEAIFSSGILKVTLSKSKNSKTRKIAVKAG